MASSVLTRASVREAESSVGPLTTGLAVLAPALCLVTPSMSAVPPAWLWGAAPSVVLTRLVFERTVLGGGVRPRVVFLVQVALNAALVALHPLFGVSAFAGYLDVPRVLRGHLQVAGVFAVAVVVSFSQVGGTVGGWATPPVFLAFVLLNVTIAATMTAAERSRVRQSAQRVQTMERLVEAERRNAALQARLAGQAKRAGVLEERARLSREIHDTVAQGLVAVVRQLGAIDPAAAPPEWRARITAADDAAREALAEARRAVAALASPRLDHDDLPTALRRLVDSWSAANGVAAKVVLDGEPRHGVADADVFRIAQEALANVARHARASRVAVTLTYDARSVRLDVRDDGVGFDPATDAAGHGLPGMRRRAHDVGGVLALETSPGSGSVVVVEVPLQAGEEKS